MPAGEGRIRIRSSAHELFEERVSVLPGSQRHDFVLRPMGHHEVAGLLLEKGRWPAPGVEIGLLNRDSGQEYTARSDPEGAYHFPAVPAGSYEVSVYSERFVLAVEERRFVLEADVSRNFSLWLPCVLTGVLSGWSPKELTQVEVTAVAWPFPAVGSVRREDGTFTFPHLAPGTWKVVAQEAESGKVAEAAVECSGDGKPIEVGLEPGRSQGR